MYIRVYWYFDISFQNPMWHFQALSTYVQKFQVIHRSIWKQANHSTVDKPDTALEMTWFFKHSDRSKSRQLSNHSASRDVTANDQTVRPFWPEKGVKRLEWNFTCVHRLAATYADEPKSKTEPASQQQPKTKKRNNYSDLMPNCVFKPVAVETLWCLGRDTFIFLNELGASQLSGLPQFAMRKNIFCMVRCKKWFHLTLSLLSHWW